MRYRGRSHERGGALVEFALVLPAFFVMMLSIMDFGLYFFVQHTLQFATREGARLALVGGTLTDASGNPLSREASIVKRVRERAGVAMDPAQVAIAIYPLAADYSAPADSASRLDAGSPGSTMRVRVSYPYTFVTPFLHVIMTDGVLRAHAQATYRNELY